MAKTTSRTTKHITGEGSGNIAHRQVMKAPSPVSTAAKPGITPPSKPSPSTVQKVGVTGPMTMGKGKKGC